MSRASRSSSNVEAVAAPRRAGFGLRLIAASMDAGIAFALTLALSSTLGMFFARRAVITLRIGQPDTLWQGPIPMLLGTIGEVIYLLPLTFLLVWLLDPVTGATPGKRLLGLRVRATDGGPALPRVRWRRALIQDAGLWGWTAALLLGSWTVAALATVAGAVVVLGSVASLGRERLALHDRLAGTSVRRAWR